MPLQPVTDGMCNAPNRAERNAMPGHGNRMLIGEWPDTHQLMPSGIDTVAAPRTFCGEKFAKKI